jgi:hypothetical protein
MIRIGFFLFLAIPFFLPPLAHAVDLGVNSLTLLRFEQKNIPGFQRRDVIPATQFIGAHLDKLGDGNLSLHLYGWGRVDLADRSTAGSGSDGDLAYAYLSYRFPKADGEIKAGRFYVREGVAVEQIDGAAARADILKWFTISLFGGAPVRLDMTEWNKGDYIAGGRAGFRLPGFLELGFSGLHEGNVKIDPLTGATDDRQMAGADIWLSPVRFIEVNGHTFYNAATGGLAEHSYLLGFRPYSHFSMFASYDEQHFKNFFTYSNIRSLFNPDNGGELKYYGGGVIWAVAAPLEMTADYRRYNRASNVNNPFNTDSNGNSNRYGGEARLTLFDKKLRSGLSYHRADGARGFNSYHEVRGYGLYDSGRYVASLDAIGQFFKNAIFGKKDAYQVTASAGCRIWPELYLSGDLSYGQNPQFSDELRGVLRLSYNYNSAK